MPLSLGAMVSFFALCLSCLNAGARVIYAMGRHGIFHAATADGASHQRDAACRGDADGARRLRVPALAILDGMSHRSICFNYVGTCAAFGFVVAYTLITVAAPVYLKRLGELSDEGWRRLRRLAGAAGGAGRRQRLSGPRRR